MPESFKYSFPEKDQPQLPNHAVIDALTKALDINNSAKKLLASEKFVNRETDYSFAEHLGQTVSCFNDYIQNGEIPPEYALNEEAVDKLNGRVDKLSDVFEIMRDQGWQPEIILVPQFLELDQWQDLVGGHTLPGTNIVTQSFNTSNLIYDPNSRTSLMLFDSTLLGRAEDTSLWDVAAISTLNAPAIRDVSYNLEHGADNFAQADELLSSLDEYAAIHVGSHAVELISPSYNTYLALQLARIACNKQPVDSPDDEHEYSNTNLKEYTVPVPTSSPSSITRGSVLSAGWYTDRVKFGYNTLNNHSPNNGIRPTVRAKDLL